MANTRDSEILEHRCFTVLMHFREALINTTLKVKSWTLYWNKKNFSINYNLLPESYSPACFICLFMPLPACEEHCSYLQDSDGQFYFLYSSKR